MAWKIKIKKSSSPSAPMQDITNQNSRGATYFPHKGQSVMVSFDPHMSYTEFTIEMCSNYVMKGTHSFCTHNVQ